LLCQLLAYVLADPLTTLLTIFKLSKPLQPCSDDIWRMMHKVWQPAFYADSVRACAPLMSHTSRKLVARLQGIAAGGGPVDLWREVGKLTMAIVGTAAYG
jgi:thromboxane-A synthase/cytochrome P450 family 3 subfamily A